MSSDSEVGKFIYFLINVAMLLFGAAIGRRVYTVFGALGIAGYLGHLSYKVFKDSLVFPVALMLIGLGVVWLGVIWQRHEAAINSALQRWLPEQLRRTPGTGVRPPIKGRESFPLAPAPSRPSTRRRNALELAARIIVASVALEDSPWKPACLAGSGL